MWDFRLPPQCNWGLHSAGMSHGVGWYLVTDILGQPVNSLFKSQAVHSSQAAWPLKMKALHFYKMSGTI
jgi:hypothetical protein